MSTYYGVNATLRKNQVPVEFIDAQEHKVPLKFLYDEYELSADLSSGDIIEMCDVIPKGALVHNVVLAFDDLDGSGGTLDVGWLVSADLDSSGSAVEAADTDGFLADVDVASAADITTMLLNKAGPIHGMLKQFSAEVQPAITIDGDTDATSGTIRMVIYYSLI